MSGNDGLAWGIVGAANISAKVARAIHRVEGSRIVAIGSRFKAKAEAWAKEHQADRAHESYQAVLDDPAVEAVYIPLPPALHAEWTIRAAKAGKHVLCEKPLAVSVEESLSLIDACQKADVALMDGVMWVHHPRTAKMRADLDEGLLGDLKRVTAAFTFRWDEIPVDNIRVKKDLAGGCLGDLGYYCVRAILWALGDLPQKVYASARYHDDVEMNLMGMLWFEGGRTASFDCGFDTVMRQWFEVAGVKASMVCDDFVLPVSEKKARYWIHDPEGVSGERAVHDAIQEVAMIEDFTAAVRTGAGREAFVADALATMRVCEALERSARQDRPIEISRG